MEKWRRTGNKGDDVSFHCFGIRAYSIHIVLTIFNERSYFIFKSIFHKALNLFQFDCEITLESVPRTNCLVLVGFRDGFERDFTIELNYIEGLMED